MGKLTRAERETGILWDEEGKTALVWTASLVVKRRMEKLWGPGRPVSGFGAHSWDWRIPVSAVRLPRPRRVLSVKQRESLSRARASSGL